MKKQLFCALVVGALVSGCGQNGQDAAKVSLDTEMERVSYGFGLQLGMGVDPELGLDVTAFSAGFRDALEDREWQLSEEEIAQALQNFQQKQMEREMAGQGDMEQQMAAMQEQAEANKAASEAFLAANAEQEGVVSLESGLQYKVLEEGDGIKPRKQDTVEVRYRGTLIDGTEFDNSEKHGDTVSFPLDRVIAGWTEGMQLMSKGAKWRLFVPSDLAYGPGGTGGPIGPNAALIFDVELVDVIRKED